MTQSTDIPEAYSEEESVSVTTTLEVRLFSVLADRVGSRQASLQIEFPATAAGVLTGFAAQFEGVRGLVPVIRVAVNREYVGPDHIIHAGDEVALITPTSGG